MPVRAVPRQSAGETRTGLAMDERHSDLTEPPGPLIRWALLVILGLCCWAAGIPLVIRDWLGPIIIAGALILPDVAGFGIAGVRLDLKEAKDELASLKLRVDMRQGQWQEVNLNFPTETVTQSTRAEIGEMAIRQAANLPRWRRGARRRTVMNMAQGRRAPA